MPGKKNNNRGQSSKAMIKRLEHRIQGVSIKARADPPSIVESPWFNVVVSFESNITVTAINHTPNSVRSQLVTQLGIPSTVTNYAIRIREVRVWGPLGANITMVVHDYSNLGELSTISDVGSLTNRPHGGYIFPSGIASRPISGNTNPLLDVTTTATSTITGTISTVVQYLIQFRFSPDVA